MCLFLSAKRCLNICANDVKYSALVSVKYNEFEVAYNNLKGKYSECLSLPFNCVISHTPLRQVDAKILRFDDYAHCDIDLEIPESVSNSRKARIRKEFSKNIIDVISKNNPRPIIKVQ